MKKNLLILLLMAMALGGWAQSRPTCGTVDAHRMQLQNPVLAKGYAQSAAAAAAWRNSHTADRTSGDQVYTIPVVVHVLYLDSLQNIPTYKIQREIEVLNADFRRMNSDTTKTPLEFRSIAADVEIEFCLATLDPNGDTTSGITRTLGNSGPFGYYLPGLENAKFDSLGGHDAWPTNRYLNIWVCDLQPNYVAYAQQPGGDSAIDGVVVRYEFFGIDSVPGSPEPGYLTHEVGHYLGLLHTWGDDQYCVGSDSVYDTPNASAGSNFTCQYGINTCANEDPYWGTLDPNDMVQNYMDYSFDTCMNLFTIGQKQRMHSFLFGDPRRNALLYSHAGCNPPVAVPPTPLPQINLYPNPSDGRVKVSYAGNWSPRMLVEVISVTGQLVYRYQAEEPSYTLDLSGLAAGAYVMRFMGEGGVVTRKLLLD